MQIVVKGIDHVEEVEPAVFEIIVMLEEGTTASLRMSDLTMRLLMAEIVAHTIAGSKHTSRLRALLDRLDDLGAVASWRSYNPLARALCSKGLLCSAVARQRVRLSALRLCLPIARSTRCRAGWGR